MSKLLTFLFAAFVSSAFAQAQSYKLNAGEDPKEFVARIAPPEARDVKVQLKSNFNNATQKIVYSFFAMESGAIINDKDSSKCIYIGILTPVSENSTEYEQQTFRTSCNYRNAINLAGVSIFEEKKQKKLQVDVTEVVRGPGGLLRNVTRNYIYVQKKEGDSYTDVFDSVNE